MYDIYRAGIEISGRGKTEEMGPAKSILYKRWLHVEVRALAAKR